MICEPVDEKNKLINVYNMVGHTLLPSREYNPGSVYITSLYHTILSTAISKVNTSMHADYVVINWMIFFAMDLPLLLISVAYIIAIYIQV